MKTIDYRGGIVRFRIPSDWVEEYEDDGGGTFYLDEEDSPTLRLNVLTFETPEPVTEDFVPKVLHSCAQKNGAEIRLLGSGCGMVAYSEDAVDGGDRVTMHYWQVANPIPPQHGRLAIFSLSTLESQQGDSDLIELVKQLDHEICDCDFSSELGT